MTNFASLPIVGWSGTLLDLVKLNLGIEGTDDDVALTRACNVAGAAAESFLDRVIAQREVEENYPHHFGTVRLAEWPVDLGSAITVTLDGVAQGGYSPFIRRGKQADLTRTGHAHDSPMDWRRYEQVAITYTAGYASLPADMAEAISWTAADIYRAEGSGETPTGTPDVKSVNIFDVGSISYDTGGSIPAVGLIPATSVEVLSRYRRVEA